ncbi:MAG: HNH endonuclease signature motif containing protein [Phycisphaerae bacterium]
MVDGKFSENLLHRDIWEDANGPIPKGYIIHHKDGNPLNNEPDNLQCVSTKEHGQLHKEEYAEERREHIDKIRPLAKAWHRSDEGRKWHSEHGKKTWENREMHKKICAQCGKEFMSPVNRKSDKTFCSRLCISRYNEQHKRYWETRKCAVCGKEFEVKKSKAQKYCSHECAGQARSTKDERQCIVCGKTFVCKKSKDQKTCSRECGYIARARNSSGIQS